MLLTTEQFENFLDRSADKNKICKLLKVASKSNFQYLLDTSKINHIGFGDNGTLSFLPVNKELYVDGNNWESKNFQTGKPSTVVRKLFRDYIENDLKQTDYEEFTNLVKSKGLDTKFKFEIVEGEKIAETYGMNLYSNSGDLGKSCMNHDKGLGYFGIYTDNPDVCKMIRCIHVESNKLAGRALLWTLDDGKTFMDRIYGVDDSYVYFFRTFAEDNDIDYMKSEQSYNEKTSFIDLKNGEEKRMDIRVDLDTDFDNYPYIDTLTYGDDGFITNDEYYNTYEYNNTDGSRGYECYTAGEYRGQPIDEDYVVYVNGESYHAHDGSIVQVYNNNEYMHIEDTIWCADIQDYVSDDCDVYFVEEEGECYYDDSSLVYIEEDGNWYLDSSDSIVEIDGDLYLKSSRKVIEDVDGNYILIDGSVQIDGEYYLEYDKRICQDVDGNYILIDGSVQIDGEYYLEYDERICQDVDGNYILIDDSVQIDGECYHCEDDRITLTEEGEYIIL